MSVENTLEDALSWGVRALWGFPASPYCSRRLESREGWHVRTDHAFRCVCRWESHFSARRLGSFRALEQQHSRWADNRGRLCLCMHVVVCAYDGVSFRLEVLLR